jgi:hypothetical protein
VTTFARPAPTPASWLQVLGPAGSGPDGSVGTVPALAAESARYALAAVEFYAARAYAADDALADVAVALLADLMHLADHACLDFPLILARAAAAYEADLR